MSATKHLLAKLGRLLEAGRPPCGARLLTEGGDPTRNVACGRPRCRCRLLVIEEEVVSAGRDQGQPESESAT